MMITSLVFSFARAEENENERLDYGDQPIVDSDLDGLTNQAEIQIYGTDYKSVDTDSDGLMDGVEVVNGTSPLDVADPEFLPVLNVQETPWAWYIGRASGIIGFVFLWITIFLGLAIRNPLLKKIVEPIYSFDFHCFIAAVAVFWALVHGTSFLFDAMLGFGMKDILIPFFNQAEIVHSNPLALGIMAFWMMMVMTITSYLRNHMSHWLWRVLHFLNPLAFIFVVVHGYVIGTDMKNTYISSTFLFSSFLLALIYLLSLVFMVINKIRQRQFNESE
ncbi:MAG: Ferric reductase domain protein transmembrane component domain protein [Candidatus Moranbacteria bacterium GW2011_GWA2_39_41]|nr:MAG: Ferric reductase domain protein transmembrane component domain protein [Candidatus Moranbacteria bacterium GW2011_GWA2_39_41]